MSSIYDLMPQDSNVDESEAIYPIEGNVPKPRGIPDLDAWANVGVVGAGRERKTGLWYSSLYGRWMGRVASGAGTLREKEMNWNGSSHGLVRDLPTPGPKVGSQRPR